MQGQDHGTITLATLHPGRPKPLTSHPVKVAGAPSQDNYPPQFLSFQHSLLIPLPCTTSCIISWSICWFSVRAGSGFYAMQLPVWRKTRRYSMLLPSSGAVTLVHLFRLIDAVSSRHQRQLSKMPRCCRNFTFEINTFSTVQVAQVLFY